MKVKVHDWNLPANEKIILPLAEHNYHQNFIDFLIKPLPSALTCSTTAVNLLTRMGICFSLSTKVFISTVDVCESRELAPFCLCSYGSFFSPLPLSITHDKFALTWLPINYPVSCCYVLWVSWFTCHRAMMWWTHLRASSLEWEQAPSHFKQVKTSGRWQDGGDVLEWPSDFPSSLSMTVWSVSPQQFYFSNFSYRLGLLRYFLLNFY